VPGWVSTTTIATVTGVLMLFAFKYTSRQSAIKQTRNQIKANLLSLSLFKENVWVGLQAQGRILANAGRLMWLSLIPMLVMTIPMILLLGQLALWYQARPLQANEEAVLTVRLNAGTKDALDKIALEPNEGIESAVGPVRVPTKDMVCWSIRAHEPGLHELTLKIDQRPFTKQLAVGEGFMPISLQRPARHWSDLLLHPREAPFGLESPVQSIDVAYPSRQSWTAGTRTWLVYWFAMSMVAALVAKPLLKVNI
jgi:hypothetical protein